MWKSGEVAKHTLACTKHPAFHPLPHEQLPHHKRCSQSQPKGHIAWISKPPKHYVLHLISQSTLDIEECLCKNLLFPSPSTTKQKSGQSRQKTCRQIPSGKYEACGHFPLISDGSLHICQARKSPREDNWAKVTFVSILGKH